MPGGSTCSDLCSTGSPGKGSEPGLVRWVLCLQGKPSAGHVWNKLEKASCRQADSLKTQLHGTDGQTSALGHAASPPSQATSTRHGAALASSLINHSRACNQRSRCPVQVRKHFLLCTDGRHRMLGKPPGASDTINKEYRLERRTKASSGRGGGVAVRLCLPRENSSSPPTFNQPS